MADEKSSNTPAEGGENPLLRLSIRTKALVVANEYTHRQMEPNELARVLVALAPTAEERTQIARAVEEELRAARYPLNEIVRLMGKLIPEEEEERAGPVPAPEPEPGPPPAPAAEPAPDAPAPNVEAAQGAEPPPVEPRPAVAPANEKVLVTQKVRAPHLMPFERYEFQEPEAVIPEPSEAPGAPAREPPPPTQKMPVADAASAASALESRAKDRAPPDESAPKVKKVAGQPVEFSKDRFKDMGASKPEPSGSKGIVLVADDDARARVMYRMKLEQSGFDVREAKDGIEAWKLIKAGEIEFLVTDMKMPGYHGLEILGRMIDAGIKIPVVVVSAFDQLENEFVVSTYPKLKFMPKPASPESVAAAVGAFAREVRKQGG